MHQNIGRIPPPIDIVLLLNRLKQVEHYDPGDLTIGVGAGITIAELDRLVSANRQLLPIDPAARDRVTLGGAIATNTIGSFQHRFGGIREFLLGVQFVTPDGKIAKAGGRVVKNVAGYDLMKLMTGSFGTLGVIVSANLKVFPRPQQFHTFICGIRQPSPGNRISRPHLAVAALSALPRNCLAGSAHHDSRWRSARRMGRVRSRGWKPCCARPVQAGTRRLRIPRRRRCRRRDVLAYGCRLGTTVDSRQTQFGSRPRKRTGIRVENALESASVVANRVGLHWAALGRAAGSFVVSFSNSENVEKLATAVTQYREALGSDSMAIIAHCPTALKSHVDVWGSTPTDVAAMRAVRVALDPKQILNRGRFLV